MRWDLRDFLITVIAVALGCDSSPPGEQACSAICQYYCVPSCCSGAPPPEPGPPSGSFDCTKVAGARGLLSVEKPIPGRYVVVLHEGGTKELSVTASRLAYGASAVESFRYAVQGFSASMTQARALEIARDPAVAFVEPEVEVSVLVVGKPDPVAEGERTASVASWGLDRVDQRALPLDDVFDPGSDGAGVHAYVVDTGLDPTHPEFAGRVGEGFSAISTGGTLDGHGHGTHVSGTVAGATFGIARGAIVHPVRVLDASGRGTSTGIIRGLDWVIQHVLANRWPAVGNMSLGGSASSAIDTAVCRAIAAGVQFAVAAGNSAQPACSSSPARVWQALVTAASDAKDASASWTNRGPCADLYAPGVAIVSAQRGGGSVAMSGTSMASPHVAGIAALCLARHPGLNAAGVHSCVLERITKNVITNPPSGTPNKLAYARDDVQ